LLILGQSLSLPPLVCEDQDNDNKEEKESIPEHEFEIKFLRREGEGGHLGARTSQNLTLLSQQFQRFETRDQDKVVGEGEGARTSQSRTLLGHHVQGRDEDMAQVEVVEEEGGSLSRIRSITLSLCLAVYQDLAISLPHSLC